MNFFFDNNLPAQLAHGLAALSRNESHVAQVVHLTDLFRPAEKDAVWIPSLAERGGPWYVISLDKFKKDHRAERHAIARAGLTVYVLDPQWGSHQYWLKAERIVLWWPHILQHALLSAGGVFRVPWARTAQTRFQSM